MPGLGSRCVGSYRDEPGHDYLDSTDIYPRREKNSDCPGDPHFSQFLQMLASTAGSEFVPDQETSEVKVHR